MRLGDKTLHFPVESLGLLGGKQCSAVFSNREISVAAVALGPLFGAPLGFPTAFLWLERGTDAPIRRPDRDLDQIGKGRCRLGIALSGSGEQFGKVRHRAVTETSRSSPAITASTSASTRNS